MKRAWLPALAIVTAALLFGFSPADFFGIGGRREAAALAKIERELIALQRESGTRAALDEFRRRMDSSATVAAHCHPIAHALGHEAFSRSVDFAHAMSFQDDVCNSGYVHGVIESLFMTSKDADAVAADTCAAAKKGSYRQWSCWHGIGHGHMTATSNDLPEVLSRCGAYDDAFARTACVNGAFMENFNTDTTLHPSQYLRTDDLFYPCDEIDESHRDACYFYAPTWYLRRHPRDYAGALAWCETADHGRQGTCASGTGSQAMKENIASPDVAVRVCGDGPEYMAYDCIDGMIGLYVNHHASAAAGIAFCQRIDARYRTACLKGVDARMPLFESQE